MRKISEKMKEKNQQWNLTNLRSCGVSRFCSSFMDSKYLRNSWRVELREIGDFFFTTDKTQGFAYKWGTRANVILSDLRGVVAEFETFRMNSALLALYQHH